MQIGGWSREPALVAPLTLNLTGATGSFDMPFSILRGYMRGTTASFEIRRRSSLFSYEEPFHRGRIDLSPIETASKSLLEGQAKFREMSTDYRKTCEYFRREQYVEDTT
jgi:hypothetical protein